MRRAQEGDRNWQDPHVRGSMFSTGFWRLETSLGPRTVTPNTGGSGLDRAGPGKAEQCCDLKDNLSLILPPSLPHLLESSCVPLAQHCCIRLPLTLPCFLIASANLGSSSHAWTSLHTSCPALSKLPVRAMSGLSPLPPTCPSYAKATTNMKIELFLEKTVLVVC